MNKMEQYLSKQKPNSTQVPSNKKNPFIPPLNTDIRFSQELEMHLVTDKEMPYTNIVTSGSNTPVIDMENKVSFSYNPKDYDHLAKDHPKTLHMHHEIAPRFSWCEESDTDTPLIKIKKSLISKPKTQHACGSCFAICTAQVFSDCLVVSGAVGWAPNISETWILANLPSKVQGGCGGGNPAVIAPVLETQGALDSSCVDYSWCENDKNLCASMSSARHFDAKALTSRLNEKIPRKGCWFPQKRFLYKLNKGSDVFFINPKAPKDVFRKTVKTHIYDFGPCVGGYVVLANFMSGEHTRLNSPTKGIYFEKCNYDGWLGISWGSTSKPEGLHAVAIVGWGEEENVEYTRGKRGTVPYWHCRNSWGKDWGYQGGFFRMAMYPFNTYSQFDKEVMTSLGGPVGSMVLLRATIPPTIIDAGQVDVKYREARRSLPDTYYQGTPEDVVAYNRMSLSAGDVPVQHNHEEIAYDIVTQSNSSEIALMVGLIIVLCVLFYPKFIKILTGH